MKSAYIFRTGPFAIGAVQSLDKVFRVFSVDLSIHTRIDVLVITLGQRRRDVNKSGLSTKFVLVSVDAVSPNSFPLFPMNAPHHVHMRWVTIHKDLGAERAMLCLCGLLMRYRPTLLHLPHLSVPLLAAPVVSIAVFVAVAVAVVAAIIVALARVTILIFVPIVILVIPMIAIVVAVLIACPITLMLSAMVMVIVIDLRIFGIITRLRGLIGVLIRVGLVVAIELAS